MQVVDEYNLIGKDLFKKETDMAPFMGLSVTLQANGAYSTTAIEP